MAVSRGDHEIGEARDVPTLAAEKVRGVVGVTVVAGHLETPGAVPELRAAQEPHLGQVHEVPVQRATVPGVHYQGIDDL